MLTEELLERGCLCHTGHPPCCFCTEMNEEEADAYCKGGMVALRKYVEEVGAYEEWDIW